MKISALKVGENKFGLKAAEIDRLTGVVALVGKNGSGKTRLLNYVAECLNDYINFIIYLTYLV